MLKKFRKLSSLAAEKNFDNIDEIIEDKAKFVEQDHSKATYAEKIDKKESKLIGTVMPKIIER